jgi:pimeloyl-ACP methyl ester carboxylesterase
MGSRKVSSPQKRQRRYHYLRVREVRFELPAQTEKIECLPPSGDPAPELKVEELWVPIEGGRMRYLKAGSGRPIILIHGLLAYAFSWRFAIPALAQCSTVYAVDSLGAGKSRAVPGMDCSMRASAERILRFVDALGIREFDLLGTSHGGAVAMMAAARYADRGDSRLRRLILVDPANPWSAHGRLLAPVIGSPLGKAIFRRTFARWRFLDYLWLRRMFGDGAKIPPDSLEGYRLPARENDSFEHGLRIVSTWTQDMKELKAEIPKIAGYPTLLMWGTRDRIVYCSSAEPLRAWFRNVRLVTFDGVGHLPYEECPAEFNRALVDFLCESTPETI